MQLIPRYGTDPVIVLDGSPAWIAEPAIRQRRRLAATVAAFTDVEWAHPSRCAGWSNRDVIAHLDSTNTFWSYSITAGLQGEPTQVLAAFDPVATPAMLVAGVSALPAAEVLERFLASTEALVGLWEGLDGGDWSILAEAPPGHLSISAVAHHALWDGWVHERDVLVPMDVAPDEEADEVTACLRYAAALAPAFALNHATVPAGTTGTLAVVATDPDVSIGVEVGAHVSVRAGSVAAGSGDADLELIGEAVALVDALSIRRPLDQPIPPGSAWLLRGLAEAFDVGST